MSLIKNKMGIALLILSLLLQGCSGGGGDSGGDPDDVINPVTNKEVIQCTIGTSSGPVNNLDCTDTVSGPNVWLEGVVTYDRVGHKANGGLNYSDINALPVRGATVDAVYPGGVQSVATNDAGAYKVCVPKNTADMLVRVNAELYRTGAPSWDFSVVDNTSGQALYVMQASVPVLSADLVGMDLHAASGWDGSAYTATRVAAPFAILDSVYDAFNTVLADCPGAQFPELIINWSVNNLVDENNFNIAAGRIYSTAFDGEQIYVLGKANADTDEYDGHVIIHEWAHYFEHSFSRLDSIGGPHSGGDVLDIRVAFSEGFSNAYSAIASGDVNYNDSGGTDQSLGFSFNLEDNNCTNKGWYSECSIQSIVYDLHDGANDDGVNLGFTPLFDVLISEQRFTTALTSIFSFVHEVKQNNVSESGAINTLVNNQNIDSITDIYGDSELTNNPGAVDKLPVYETIGFGQLVNVCSTAEHQNYNGLGVSRFLRFDLDRSRTVRISATRTSGLPYADPDIILHYKGEGIAMADSTISNSETLTGTLSTTGTYIIEVFEYSYREFGVGTTCFNVQLGSI